MELQDLTIKRPLSWIFSLCQWEFRSPDLSTCARQWQKQAWNRDLPAPKSTPHLSPYSLLYQKSLLQNQPYQEGDDWAPAAQTIGPLSGELPFFSLNKG